MSLDLAVSSSCAWACVLGLVTILACRRSPEEQAALAEGRHPDATSPRSHADRLPAFEGEVVGLQPGYIDGAFAYASVRAGAIASVPTELLGLAAPVDLADYGIDPDARISVSLRSLATHADEVRRALEADERPSELPAEIVEKAVSLGVHVRVHVGVADPTKLGALIEAATAEPLFDRFWTAWPKTCRALAASGPLAACVGSDASLLVIRTLEGAVVADLLLAGDRPTGISDDRTRRALALAAVELPSASSVPAVEALRGDATLWIDSPRTIAAVRTATLLRMVNSLRWYGSGMLGRHRAEDQALRQLHETTRLFEAVSVELSATADDVIARARWHPTADARARLSSVFELTPIDADVPSIAALCEGATLCGRSRGLPARARFARLATGIYGDPGALEQLLGRFPLHAALVLALETWPNAVGAAAHVPAGSFEPRSMIRQSALEIGERALGFGFSCGSPRSLSQDWVAYARMSGDDLDSLRRMFTLADVDLQAVTLAGFEGRAEYARLPRSSSFANGNGYVLYDPAVGGGRWGWAALAEHDHRVAWLAGLAHDDGAVPIAYVEAPDLWRLCGSVRAWRRRFEGAREWLDGRWLRAQVVRGEAGVPELHVGLGLGMSVM